MSTIASTIHAQLGGSRFSAMVGARLVAGADTLEVRHMVGKDKINHTSIRLDAGTDTYTVKFWRIRGINCTEVAVVDGLHADDLARVFAERTGLRTSL